MNTNSNKACYNFKTLTNQLKPKYETHEIPKTRISKTLALEVPGGICT